MPRRTAYNTDDFGDWLRVELDRRGMTMTHLAQEMGVSQATVSRWVSNQRHPDAESAEQIALALDVPVDIVMQQAGVRRLRDERLGHLRATESELMADLRRLDAERMSAEERLQRTREEIARIERQTKESPRAVLDRMMDELRGITMPDETRREIRVRLAQSLSAPISGSDRP